MSFGPSGSAVFLANVHMVVEGRRRPDFAAVLLRAELLLPDGMPLVWLMRAGGAPRQVRVAGMDVLPAVCGAAARGGVAVFFLGGTDLLLTKLRERLQYDFPDLQIAGMVSPPFRPLTSDEDRLLSEQINQSGAGIVLVALGCPKQEEWIDSHRNSIGAVMVGLGAAFGVYAGLQRRAPLAMQQSGLEWLYRLTQEPGRLWKRYLVTNCLFTWYVVSEGVRKLLRPTREDVA